MARKLFMRRTDQSDSVHQAKEHGSEVFLCFFEEFPTPKQLRRVKEIVLETVKCMDYNAEIEFWEE